jgi:tape measure domain-containing protein
MATQNIRIVISMTGSAQTARGLSQIAGGAARSATSIDKLYRVLRAGVVLAAGRELLKLADTYTILRNRTAVFARSNLDAQKGFEGIFDVALRSRAPLDATAELYQRLSLSLQGTGKSSGDLLRITETVTKAIAVSGTTAGEAEGALRQLAQGIAANRLSGQELNSVLEQTPIIAQLIAKELGVATGQLRSLANKTGAITTDVIIRALENSAGAIDILFAKTAVTFGQAFTQMSIAVTLLFGKLNDLTGAGAFFTKVISNLAVSIKNLASDPARLQSWLENIKLIIGLLALSLIPKLITSVIALAKALKSLSIISAFSTPWTAALAVIALVVLALFRVRDVEFEIMGITTSLADIVTVVWKNWSDWITSTTDELLVFFGLLEKGPSKTTRPAFEQAQDLTKNPTLAGGNFAPEPTFKDQLVAQRAARQEAEELSKFQARMAAVAAERADQDAAMAVKKSEAAEKLKKDQLAALNQFRDLESSLSPIIALENQRAEGLETIRNALNLKVISQERANKVEAAFTEELRLQALTLDTLSPALRGITDTINQITDSFNPAAAAARVYEEKVKAIAVAVAAGVEIQGGAAKAIENVALEYKFAAQEIDPFTQRVNESNAALRGLIGGVDPAVRVLEDYRLKLEEIGEAAKKGADPELVRQAAENATNEFTKKIVTDVQANVGPEVGGFDALSGGFNAALVKMGEDIGTQGAIIQQGFTDIFSTAGDAVKTFVETGKLDFRAFASDVISSLAGVVAKLLLVMALNSLAGGSGGGIVASIATSLGGVAGGRATGGPVGPGRTFMVGERGPEMFTPPSTGTIVPSGAMAQQPVNVTVVNVDDPSSVPRAMNTREGEEAILNVIQRNRNRIRDSVG